MTWLKGSGHPCTTLEKQIRSTIRKAFFNWLKILVLKRWFNYPYNSFWPQNGGKYGISRKSSLLLITRKSFKLACLVWMNSCFLCTYWCLFLLAQYFQPNKNLRLESIRLMTRNIYIFGLFRSNSYFDQ